MLVNPVAENWKILERGCTSPARHGVGFSLSFGVFQYHSYAYTTVLRLVM